MLCLWLTRISVVNSCPTNYGHSSSVVKITYMGQQYKCYQPYGKIISLAQNIHTMFSHGESTGN